jgi:predicted nucleic acid-binding protein
MRDPVLVDTNVFGAELGRQRRPSPLVGLYRQHLVGRKLVIAEQTVGELEYGAELTVWGEARRLKLAEKVRAAEISWPDAETARCYAQLKAACWREGHPLAQRAHDGDAWIAASAMRRGLPLVSQDGVFGGRHEYQLITELPVATT